MQTEPDNQSFYSFDKLELSALEAINEAQRLAFAPVVFHALVLLRDRGILEFLKINHHTGATIEEVSKNCNISEYGARVLLESGLGSRVCILKDGKYYLTKVGYYINSDEMTRVNMNYSLDVCYKAMIHLGKAIDHEYAAGLVELGPWRTIYEGLSILPEPAKKSWFEFDHFYSDHSFKQMLPILFKYLPKQIFDIGGNTGKFSIDCCNFDPDVQMTICDLPVQLEAAEKNLSQSPFKHRIKLQQLNVLTPPYRFTEKADAIVMSQFLDCFSPKEITDVLLYSKDGINENGRVFIIETIWDRQRFEASAFCLQQTSLYFTAVANGNSKMYGHDQFSNCIKNAGYEIEEIHDNLGISHTLYICKPI